MPPKRSNKTARVLNLITKPEQNIESSDSIEEKSTKDAVDSNMSDDAIAELLAQHNEEQQHSTQAQHVQDSSSNMSDDAIAALFAQNSSEQTQSEPETQPEKTQNSNAVMSDDAIAALFAQNSSEQTQSEPETQPEKTQNSNAVMSDDAIAALFAQNSSEQTQSEPVTQPEQTQDSNTVMSDDAISTSFAQNNTESISKESTQANTSEQSIGTELPPVPQPVVPILQNVRDQEAQLEDQICSELLSSLEQEEEKTHQPEVNVSSETISETELSKDTNTVISDDTTAVSQNNTDTEKDLESNPQSNSQPINKPVVSKHEDYFGAAPHGKRSVRYVNILQELVEEESIYSSQMLKCHCPRCLADMKALTLTNLPSKYVVIEDDQKNGLMRIYASRYSRLISVQMMKACVIVNENPHH